MSNKINWSYHIIPASLGLNDHYRIARLLKGAIIRIRRLHITEEDPPRILQHGATDLCESELSAIKEFIAGAGMSDVEFLRALAENENAGA